MTTLVTSGLYKCKWFHVNAEVQNLFKHLINTLEPMNKRGSMSGKCEVETQQMEMFLDKNFGFETVPGKNIVPGVQLFRVDRLPCSSKFNKDAIIYFPNATHSKPFMMTIDELRHWQNTFIVYTTNDRNLSIDKEFLVRALQGQSKDGDEGFRMKFVIRISTCPIMMQMDGTIINRDLNEDWPNRIKLVSVSGVNFAGRMHEINDIMTYLINWRDVFQLDKGTGKPLVYGGRDFMPKKFASTGLLDEKRLYDDLLHMVRLRLRACDNEGVQIVVETGIGLGIFAGEQINIHDKVRSLSAKATKQILEEDGTKYAHILGVLFALPILEADELTSTYKHFVDIFESDYHGPIPVLIADQDMHRLTIAAARQGFNVAELNPADPYGVFGEYWQARVPAVEGKLALTTVGLLVQHHIFNGKNILNPENYRFITTNKNS